VAAGLRHLLVIPMIVMVHGVPGIRQGLAQSDPASVIRIELTEYAFTPAQVTLKAGRPVTLNVVNVGWALPS
jgi:hypothetical protein